MSDERQDYGRVKMITTYTRYPDETVSEKVVCEGMTLYEGPTRCVFLDIPEFWPWDKENNN